MNTFPTTARNQAIALGVGALAIGGLLTWLEGGFGKKDDKAGGVDDETGSFGGVESASHRYASQMRASGTHVLGRQVIGPHLVLVWFGPQAHNDVWGRANIAEQIAQSTGSKVALTTGPPDKMAVAFADHPQDAEQRLRGMGFTSIEPAGAWAAQAGGGQQQQQQQYGGQQQQQRRRPTRQMRMQRRMMRRGRR